MERRLEGLISKPICLKLHWDWRPKSEKKVPINEQDIEFIQR